MIHDLSFFQQGTIIVCIMDYPYTDVKFMSLAVGD